MIGIRTAIRHIGLFACFAYGAGAADISGNILVRKELNAKTIERGLYDLRGIAVAPAAENRSAFDHIAVWLQTINISRSATPATVKMQQQGRRFRPDLVVIPIGSTVEFPNLDPIFHNIFSLSRPQAFDLGYYSQGKSRTITFDRPGVVQVYCHIHADMYGVIVVAPTQWFGIPDDEGAFLFHQVPEGEYDLLIWQRKAGLSRKKLLVRGSGVVHTNIALPANGGQ